MCESLFRTATARDAFFVGSVLFSGSFSKINVLLVVVFKMCCRFLRCVLKVDKLLLSLRVCEFFKLVMM